MHIFITTVQLVSLLGNVPSIIMFRLHGKESTENSINGKKGKTHQRSEEISELKYTWKLEIFWHS